MPSTTGDQIERLRKIAEAPGLGFKQAVSASARFASGGLISRRS